jgi:tRNA threonylcarbamoyladenosine biosynthesis protein TsaE
VKSVAEFTSDSPEQTIELGRKIGEQLKGGELICLLGQLGSGKTHFVKGLAKGLGARDSQRVSSPTFVIINEYSGRLELFLIDAYRIEKPADFEMLGFDDLLYPGAVVVIEWADRVRAVLKNISCIEINFEYASQTQRIISIKNMPFEI